MKWLALIPLLLLAGCGINRTVTETQFLGVRMRTDSVTGFIWKDPHAGDAKVGPLGWELKNYSSTTKATPEGIGGLLGAIGKAFVKP
jgi:hypothetical protein